MRGLVIIGLVLGLGPNALTAADVVPSSRMAPFAPLIGDWDIQTFSLQNDGSTKEGQATWSFWWILDGRALMDEWRATKATGGEFVGVNIRSWNEPDARYDVRWLESEHQVWRAYEGQWQDGRFVMEGDAVSPSGKPGRSRITFHDLTASHFSWTMDWSSDGGSHWAPAVFRIVATRR